MVKSSTLRVGKFEKEYVTISHSNSIINSEKSSYSEQSMEEEEEDDDYVDQNSDDLSDNQSVTGRSFPTNG